MAAAMRIYHAGDLFDFKHLSGNRLLSDAVQKVSHGFYQTILPQDTEGNQLRNTSIRNGDLELVEACRSRTRQVQDRLFLVPDDRNWSADGGLSFFSVTLTGRCSTSAGRLFRNDYSRFLCRL